MSAPPPRRSVLYVPGSNARALAKARTLAADALILDLEDAVAPESKPAARDRVCAALHGGGFGPREVAVRINALDTEWGEADLAEACAAAPDAILVPKVDSARTVRAVAERIGAAAPEGVRLWSMLETPLGILSAREIAAASPLQDVWVVGTHDLARALGCRTAEGREPLQTALGLCLLAARAFGLALLDGVYGAIRDAEGFRAECRQARDLGFDGKTLIHPSQIDDCNALFAPSDEDLAQARRTVAAFERAREEGRGVAVLDGRMIENLHVESARRTLALAEKLDARAREMRAE